MRYALNTKKGSTINHPSVGKLEGGIAREVTEEEANQVKHMFNVVVFEGFEDKKD